MRVLGLALAVVGAGLLYLAVTGKNLQDLRASLPAAGKRLGFGDFRKDVER